MSSPEQITSSQDLLEEFLLSQDPADADRAMETLFAKVIDPLVRTYLRRKLRAIDTAGAAGNDAQEIESEVRVSMVEALLRARERYPAAVLRSIEAYTQTVVRNSYNEYLRRKYPNRFRLRNQLRYMIGRSEELSLIASYEQGWICGTRMSINGSEPGAVVPVKSSDPDLADNMFEDIPRSDLKLLTTTILARVGRSILLDDLVHLVAELQGIRETTHIGLDDRTEMASRSPATVGTEEIRPLLRQLWAEVLRLPVRHRRALLLHLTDDENENLLLLLPAEGVASVRAIAEAIEMPALEFAELWNRLPLTDKEIAETMGLVPQQIINLRLSAKRTLRRRLADFRP